MTFTIHCLLSRYIIVVSCVLAIPYCQRMILLIRQRLSLCTSEVMNKSAFSLESRIRTTILGVVVLKCDYLDIGTFLSNG